MLAESNINLGGKLDSFYINEIIPNSGPGPMLPDGPGPTPPIIPLELMTGTPPGPSDGPGPRRGPPLPTEADGPKPGLAS